jgi:hypothetical protein
MAHTQTSSGGVRPVRSRQAPARASQGSDTSSEQRVSFEAGEAKVQEVLDRFARALTSGDGEAAADVWDTPAFVIGAGMARAVSGRAEVAAFFAGGKDQYNSRGIADTRAEIQRFDWVSEDLVVVDVRWPYLTEDGTEVGEETSSYTLMADRDGELKIRSVLMRGGTE